MAVKGRQSLLNGAIVLAVSTVVVHLIGMLYKIPLTALIGEVGRGYFNAAYDIYTPLYAVSMAGLPVAVSKLVSQNVALHRYRDARMIFRVAFRLFVITGILGTGLLLLLSYPYSLLIGNPKSLLCILVIAPSILFCCLMSAYRGYYEGMSNMVPTAISQVIEALGKLVLGLLFAFLIMKLGMAEFHAGRAVFGVQAATEAEALSAIYPYSAAGAISGVTIGTLIGYVFLFIRHRAVGDRITRAQLANAPRPAGSISIAKTLIAVAVPIVLSSLILNITNLIDAVTIQNRLDYALEKGPEIIKEANEMLRESPLNYIGYLEGKDLFEGRADVVVTDGFTGNVILKLIEGTSKYMFTEIKKLLFKNLRTKIGALFLKDGLNAFKKTLDPDINGGAPILGVDGLVLKSHGSSNAKTIRYVVLKACDLAESSFLEDIKSTFQEMRIS